MLVNLFPIILGGAGSAPPLAMPRLRVQRNQEEIYGSRPSALMTHVVVAVYLYQIF